MPATSTDALFTRLGELFVSGSGTAPYTIPAGTFGLEWFYSGIEEPKQLAKHAMTKPQVNLETVRLSDAKAWPRPSNQTMYNFEVKVSLAYYTDSKLLRNVRDNLSKTIGNNLHLISKTLQHPGNMRATAAGALTGLAGDLLEQQDEPIAFEFDAENSIVTGELFFTGQVVLSSSA